jgi:hypothetical protein
VVGCGIRCGALAALLLAGAAAPAAPPETSPGDAGLLPESGAVGNWTRAGAPRVFAGPELYELIDGGAEIVYEYGFARATVQRYRSGEDELGVELFLMRDPAAALGLYLARCGPPPTAVELAASLPPAGLVDRYTAGRHQLLLVRNRYFLVVDNLSGKAERASALLDFARAIAPRLPPDGPVEVFDLLPAEGRIAGSERLVRGPLALQAFVLLGEGDVLQLGDRVTAVAASYGGGEAGPRTLVVARYPDPEAAARALQNVVQHLDSESAVVSSEATRLVFRDYSGRFGVLAVDGARLDLTLGLARRPGS